MVRSAASRERVVVAVAADRVAEERARARLEGAAAVATAQG